MPLLLNTVFILIKYRKGTAVKHNALRTVQCLHLKSAEGCCFFLLWFLLSSLQFWGRLKKMVKSQREQQTERGGSEVLSVHLFFHFLLSLKYDVPLCICLTPLKCESWMRVCVSHGCLYGPTDIQVYVTGFLWETLFPAGLAWSWANICCVRNESDVSTVESREPGVSWDDSVFLHMYPSNPASIFYRKKSHTYCKHI